MDRDVTEGSLHAAAALAPSPVSAAWGAMFKQRAVERSTPVKIDLPSSLPVMVVRMPVRMLIKHGFVPDPLTPIIENHIRQLEGIGRGDGMESIAASFNENPEATFAQFLDVLRTVWCSCVVEPKFVMNDDDADEESGPYPVAAVDYFDLLYVYQWAQGVDQSVQDFLHEQGQTLGTLAAGESVPLSSEPVLRVERRGGRLVSVVDRPGDVAVGVEGGGVDAGDGQRSRAKAKRPADHRETEVRGAVDSQRDLRPAARRKRKDDARSKSANVA